MIRRMCIRIIISSIRSIGRDTNNITRRNRSSRRRRSLAGINNVRRIRIINRINMCSIRCIIRIKSPNNIDVCSIRINGSKDAIRTNIRINRIRSCIQQYHEYYSQSSCYWSNTRLH